MFNIDVFILKRMLQNENEKIAKILAIFMCFFCFSS